MKKILISAAIITGFIAPAIFAATQYSTYSKNSGSQPQAVVNTNSRSDVKICLKGVSEAYAKEKNKLSELYREKMKQLIINSGNGSTVSGEKAIRSQKIKALQSEYSKELTTLKNTYLQKQKTCIKK